MLQSLVLFQIASTVSTSTVPIMPRCHQFQQCQQCLQCQRSQNNLETLDFDTLLGLKDLEIAQLAHHLRPIFGLVFISPPLLPLYGYVTLPFRKEVVILSYFPCDSRNFTFHTKHSNPQEICGKLENPPTLGILTSF